MQIEKLHLDDIRYNPENGAFEALVHIHDADARISYPVDLKAPLTAEFAHIAHGLSTKAAEAHRNQTARLRSRRVAAPVSMLRPARAVPASNIVMQQLRRLIAA